MEHYCDVFETELTTVGSLKRHNEKKLHLRRVLKAKKRAEELAEAEAEAEAKSSTSST
jgi:hypothetical protein